ncbi:MULTISPECIES: hypothetical protein [unclassified Pseudochrobactrum]|uniref:hypothetical protein n=1 Tax=unclassified Pseudochrobactrum TaxID=2647013 RepID=UPI0003AAF5D0|nr:MULTISPECIES: hypothetical protein [unclassified Pseudochrobactrum]UCA44735.1 hypothetical protein LDL70_10135 [Pseudochrobactrum sp. XF203]
MYRLLAFILAVGVLTGLVFSGGFLTHDKTAQKQPDSVAAVIAHSEQELQSKADQELAEIDAKAAQNSVAGPAVLLPELKKPLTEEDVRVAVQKAGEDAEKTALSVGQTADQAAAAKKTAEDFVRVRMESQMRAEQSSANSM